METKESEWMGMGKYFSDAVDNALEAIYYCYDSERAVASLQPLADAANAGDGDASYILSRCASGPQYSWRYHPFPIDDDAVELLIHRSVENGSAMGVLGSLRCGMFTPEIEEAMKRHYPSLQAAWDAVYEKAQAGCLFAMNMIGNTYFWLDIVRIEGKSPDDFPSEASFGEYLRESELKCIPWFERAFSGGMGLAGRNLYQLYYNGDDGTFPTDLGKAETLARLGAEKGYPDWQQTYAAYLNERQDTKRQAYEYYLASAKQGHLSSWFYVGYAHEQGDVGEKDCQKAMQCYERGLQDPHEIGCANRAAELFFTGRGGIPQNYERVVQLLEHTYALNDTWGGDMLGACLLFGYGCRKDPRRALEVFQRAEADRNCSDVLYYGLGTIYTEGMGVPEDIKKGVEYFQRCGAYAPAKDAMQKFKKTIFGKWVRR